MNILLIEQYSQLIQDIIQHTDDILREVVSDDEVRQNIKHEWYPNDGTDQRSEQAPSFYGRVISDWDALLKAEEKTYTFDLSIYPDNFFNE